MQYEDGVSIKEIFYMIIKNLRLIILILLVFVIGGLLYTCNTKTVYQSTARILVNTDTDGIITSEGVTLGLRLAETIKVWLSDEVVINEVVNELKQIDEKYEEYDINRIESNLSIDGSSTTLFVTVNYTDFEIESSSLICNLIVEKGIETWDDKLEIGANIETVNKSNFFVIASPASHAIEISISRELYMILFVLVGGIVGCTVSLIKELILNKVISEEDLEKLTKSNIIGVIPEGIDIL